MTTIRHARTFVAAALACVLVVTSCGGGSVDVASTTTIAIVESAPLPSTSVAVDSSIAAAMRALLDEHIVPTHRELAVAASDLSAAAEGSCDAQRATLQEAYRTTRLAWDAARVYPLGPQVQQRMIPAVDWWPPDREKVEATAAGDELMSAPEFEPLGAAERGLPVIEHLLWSHIPLTPRRCSYVLRAADSIAGKAVSVADAFEAESEEFVTSERALVAVLGALAEATYRICDQDLGMASGANIGSTGPNLTLVRQGGASMALDDVESQLSEIEAGYEAGVLPVLEHRFPGEPDPLAGPLEEFAISVEQLGPDLVAAIETANESVIGAVDACRELRHNIMLTVPGQLGVVLAPPVGDGD